MAMSKDVLGQALYDALVAPTIGADIDCATCTGTGTCQTCGGTGDFPAGDPTGDCPECLGVSPYNCVACSGTGLEFDAVAEGALILAKQKAFADVIITHLKANMEIKGADLEVTGGTPHVD
jgi:hypothetical protein